MLRRLDQLDYTKLSNIFTTADWAAVAIESKFLKAMSLRGSKQYKRQFLSLTE